MAHLFQRLCRRILCDDGPHRQTQIGCLEDWRVTRAYSQRLEGRGKPTFLVLFHQLTFLQKISIEQAKARRDSILEYNLSTAGPDLDRLTRMFEAVITAKSDVDSAPRA